MHQIHTIQMWYANNLKGFTFMDKTGSVIKEIGSSGMKSYRSRTITLKKGETIVGFRCNKYKKYPKRLSNF